jgi:polysaccharide export outer membrane protein
MKKLMMWVMSGLLGLTMMGAATAQETTLGVGDVVKISVYGSPDLNTETRVSDKGQITFPLLGQVPVGGLTVAQAEKEIGDPAGEGRLPEEGPGQYPGHRHPEPADRRCWAR